jgi:hypothetical protein
MRARLNLPPAHTQALKRLMERIPPDRFCWVLTGSAGLRLQGVDLEVHDLDLQTDEASIYVIEQRLSSFMQVPVHLWQSPNMESLAGKAVIEGIQVELLANLLHKRPDDSLVSFTDFSRRVWVEWDGLQVPVFPLEDEARAYEAMGRAHKAALIRETIEKFAMGKSNA